MAPEPAPRRLLASAAWLLAAAASVGASVVIWRGAPEAQPAPPTPPPLPRPPTAAERAEVEALAERVDKELRATSQRVGRAPALHELEAAAPDGQPFLPSGLPDNPLVSGVAGVAPGCPGDPPAAGAFDWRYCAEPLSFRPAPYE